MDHCASLFNLYKVETIGDAYMAVSGLPDRNDDHVEHMAKFALIVQRAVTIVKNPVTGNPVRIRVGLHCGSVIAGNVGET